jgi:hypothetical protein
LALVSRSAAEADPVARANAATAAIVNFFIIQPLPVVSVRNLGADVRGRPRKEEREHDWKHQLGVPHHLNYYGHNSASGRVERKRNRAALAAFLGDSTSIHRRVTECGSEATFFLGLRAFGPATLWTTLGFFVCCFEPIQRTKRLAPRGHPANEGESPHFAALPPRWDPRTRKSRRRYAAAALARFAAMRASTSAT